MSEKELQDAARRAKARETGKGWLSCAILIVATGIAIAAVMFAILIPVKLVFG